jgi:hypothetical protein
MKYTSSAFKHLHILYCYSYLELALDLRFLNMLPLGNHVCFPVLGLEPIDCVLQR